MYRVLKMSQNYYAVKLTDNEENFQEEMEEIESFVIEGTPCIIVSDLDDLEQLGIDPDDVELVKRD